MAMAPGSPQLHPEAPGNVAIDWPGPVPNDDAKLRTIDEAFGQAAHVAKVSVRNQRLIVASMEPRGAQAHYDAAKDFYTLRCCSQGVWPQREQLVAMMGLPREKVRVITEDVGGAFGVKTLAYPEYPALLVAAKLTGRPVAWMSTRSEAFLSDQHARDTITDMELALDERGKFLALRVRHTAAMGAYIGIPGANIQTNNFSRCLPGMYAIRLIDVGVKCVFTNTVPTGPYRGAGRPEANYALERLVEEAARVTGTDPIRLRRRNLIPRKAIPYKTAVGTTYDSGDFTPILEKALALAHYAEFKKRRRESYRRGKLRGIGVSCFLEHAGALPTESASLLFPGGDRLVLGIGVQNTGQGHATVYPRLVAAKLGIPAAQIVHKHGDTNLDLKGNPSVGSRSTMTAGSALYRAADLMLEKAKPIAAGMLEAADADVAYREGHFEVVGTDRRVSLFAVAERARSSGDTLDTKATVDTPQTFPNGCHVAEVEIDPDTGVTEIVAYAAVDDAGVVLDHTLAEGQLVRPVVDHHRVAERQRRQAFGFLDRDVAQRRVLDQARHVAHLERAELEGVDPGELQAAQPDPADARAERVGDRRDAEALGGAPRDHRVFRSGVDHEVRARVRCEVQLAYARVSARTGSAARAEELAAAAEAAAGKAGLLPVQLEAQLLQSQLARAAGDAARGAQLASAVRARAQQSGLGLLGKKASG